VEALKGVKWAKRAKRVKKVETGRANEKGLGLLPSLIDAEKPQG
jgi:hypothetical protein